MKIKINIVAYRWIIVLFSFILIFLTFQKERKFRFEIQKNIPWQHDNLLAPFDFPVYKLDDELQREKDSINQNIKLQFNYDKDIITVQNQALTDYYDKMLKEFFKQDSIKRLQDKAYRKTPRLKRKDFDKIFNEFVNEFIKVYKTGIYNDADIANYKKYTNYKFAFKKDLYNETHTPDQVYTQQAAEEYLKNKLNDIIKKYKGNEALLSFFNNFDFSKFLVPNLIFDKEKTEDLHRIELNNISQTDGYVQADELIISKGEIITPEKYKILMSLKRYYENSVGRNNLILINIGNALIIALLLFMLFIYLKNNKPDLFADKNSFLMIFLLVTLFVTFTNLIAKYNLFNIYIFPLALVTIITKIFFDERLALYSMLTVIFLTALNMGNSFEYTLIQFIAGFASIFGFSHLNRRGQIYYSAISVLIAMSLIYFAIAIIQEASLANIMWKNFLYFAVNSVLILLAYPLIYIFERAFGFISDITLLEYSNTNNSLLQKLSTTAPGTFQHSLQVGNLAEEAAKKVGANHLLVKVGALYHDIGKTFAPAYFIENQVSGYNPHDTLDFKKSAEIIINHVIEGVNLAKKFGLPQQLIDFIRTHHGNSTVQYFYKNYIKKYPDKADEISQFTYPGPRPFTKEQVILMMADSLEAASRSLKEINKDKISNLVDNIIEKQMQNHQYDDANITFKEIYTLKELFKNLLINIYHARIEYPK